MARGGSRAGAGRKPSWKSGVTKTVKLPIALLERVMAFAHQIDEGIVPSEIDAESKAPATAPAKTLAGDKSASQLFRLIDEKRALESRVESLKVELARTRRKLEMEEMYAKRLQAQIADASSVMKAALDARPRGSRQGVSAKNVRSALIALGVDVDGGAQSVD